MIPLRVLLCDDEAMARRRAHRLLTALPGVVVGAECESAAEARQKMSEEEFDVCLLDIQMPHESGLELAASLPDPKPFLIFVTAHSEHAISAFEVGAVDYVLKPLEEERLAKAMTRARSYFDAAPRSLSVLPKADSGPIAIATRDGAVLFPADHVSHCTFDGQLATVYANGKGVLTEQSLTDLASKLPHLLRVHRRSLLSLAHVERLESQLSGGYVAHVRGGGSVEVSRQAARDLRRRLGIS